MSPRVVLRWLNKPALNIGIGFMCETRVSAADAVPCWRGRVHRVFAELDQYEPVRLCCATRVRFAHYWRDVFMRPERVVLQVFTYSGPMVEHACYPEHSAGRPNNEGMMEEIILEKENLQYADEHTTMLFTQEVANVKW